MDLIRAIRLAVDTGDVRLGTDSALKASLNGGAKMIVLASNLPKQANADLRHYCKMSDVPVLDYGGTSIELGTVCGKPFPVSAVTIISEGSSEILKSLEENK